MTYCYDLHFTYHIYLQKGTIYIVQVVGRVLCILTIEGNKHILCTQPRIEYKNSKDQEEIIYHVSIGGLECVAE